MQDLEFTIEKKVKLVSNDITDMSLCDKLIEKIAQAEEKLIILKEFYNDK